MLNLSKLDVIAIAACPICCAYRGEVCTFARCDDPLGKRAFAKQSHRERVILARKKKEELYIDNLPVDL